MKKAHSFTCCICGKTVEGYGNNPYPLWNIKDEKAVCCNECDNLVDSARLLLVSLTERTEIHEGDTVVTFYSSHNSMPTDYALENGKFVAGVARKPFGKAEIPYWSINGLFFLDPKTDNYAIVEKRESA